MALHSRDHVKLKTINVLLVDDCATDAQLLRLLLGSDPKFAVTTAPTLARAKVYVVQKPFDLVLLDLSLPDGEGIEAIRQLHCAARDLPIVALSGRNDEKLAVSALREGAQDYLVKPDTDRSLLMRVIRYALERHRLVAELQSMALMDTLTGLYNRRGFVTIAEEQLKLARRTGNGLALAFIDLDGMKRINDQLGHEFGDQALVTTATILKSTFRASDIIARLGGDEFIALAIAAKAGGMARVRKRLTDAATIHNNKPSAVPVAFSVGFAHADDAGRSGDVRRKAAAARQPDVRGAAAPSEVRSRRCLAANAPARSRHRARPVSSFSKHAPTFAVARQRGPGTVATISTRIVGAAFLQICAQMPGRSLSSARAHG